MEREQVIKALECCETSPKNCPSCPLARDCSPCSKTMANNALSLIKELTEDVERVRKQCGDIIVECDERDAERLKQVAELTEENERLRAFKKYFDELYGTYLYVDGWHENGALEPFDNFYESALQEMKGV